MLRIMILAVIAKDNVLYTRPLRSRQPQNRIRNVIFHPLNKVGNTAPQAVPSGRRNRAVLMLKLSLWCIPPARSTNNLTVLPEKQGDFP